MYMCPIWNGFPDRATSLYSSLDLAPNIILPSLMWISVKCQLAIVTANSDIGGVLWKCRICCMFYAVLTWIAKRTNADGEIFENVLY
jgi:hypothetical protein